MGIKFVHENRDRSRFWELFRPTTNNFQFWLATSAFAFFVYQTLYESGRRSSVIDFFLHQVIPVSFAVLGFVGILGIFYLFVTWVLDKGIKRTKPVPKTVFDLGQSISDIETKANELRKELSNIVKEAEDARSKLDGK